jgi:hypothetical protein
VFNFKFYFIHYSLDLFIFLSIPVIIKNLISAAISLLISALVQVQVSDPYIHMGRQYILNKDTGIPHF